MTPPSRKEVRQFIYLVKYYQDMWESLSHSLAHLTKITSSNVKFGCNKNKTNSFD